MQRGQIAKDPFAMQPTNSVNINQIYSTETKGERKKKKINKKQKWTGSKKKERTRKNEKDAQDIRKRAPQLSWLDNPVSLSFHSSKQTHKHKITNISNLHLGKVLQSVTID